MRVYKKHILIYISYTHIYICMYVYIHLPTYRGFPGGANGKESACQCRRLKR